MEITKTFTQDHSFQASFAVRFKERCQCYFEGGKTCYREDPAAQKGSQPYARLHANWVGSYMLAMSRPWEENLLANDSALLRQLHDDGVRLVINLQEHGEHRGCGPGFPAGSAYTYRPETFMRFGIKCVAT